MEEKRRVRQVPGIGQTVVVVVCQMRILQEAVAGEAAQSWFALSVYVVDGPIKEIHFRSQENTQRTHAMPYFPLSSHFSSCGERLLLAIARNTWTSTSPPSSATDAAAVLDALSTKRKDRDSIPGSEMTTPLSLHWYSSDGWKRA